MMKIKILLFISIIILSISIVGCNQKKDDLKLYESSDSLENLGDTSIKENNENKGREIIDPDNDDSQDKKNNSTENNNSYKVDIKKEKLMKYIKEDAIKGVNIYCEEITLGENIVDVIDLYGEPTEQNYVAKAKGLYYDFQKYNLAFGCNKGDSIFEIRSYDRKLQNINKKDICTYFGEGDYESKTSQGERILGYKVSENYKLLFVFNSDKNNEYLDHYSVFYPENTANYMADDPGREW